MATITLSPRPFTDRIRSASPRPLPPTLSLDHINTSAACPIPIPNKHLPVCPTGPAPSDKPDTPPNSPPAKELSLQPQSLLYPPKAYKARPIGNQIIYEIDADGVAAALNHIAGQPLPDPSQVFPWFHGLHPSNHIQQAFFIARRRNLRRTPKCLRGITIVKAGGDLSYARLKGAIAPDEFLLQSISGATFREIDPKEGFSVRNFQIQAAKSAMLSDVIVYGDDPVEAQQLARNIASAQKAWRESHEQKGHEVPKYNSFLCTSKFMDFEKRYPELVSTNARGEMSGKVVDFFHQERLEMCTMTKASEIAHNVWMGPTPDPAIDPSLVEDDDRFDIQIECSDLGRLNPGSLKDIIMGTNTQHPAYIEFPSSGSIMPPSWSQTEADGILESCKLIHNLAHGIVDEIDEEGDLTMGDPAKERKILIHCTDGYTESTLLGLAYFTYATGLPIPAAWLSLHVEKKRNFFAYPSDVALLTNIAPRLLLESPGHRKKNLIQITEMVKQEPEWIKTMDGSLPSRITDYMYLGNLGHANNPELLREMGIRQILSVGETASWRDGESEAWGEENVMLVQRVQDNGVDPLTDEFTRCLDFIERGRLSKTATLVHCRVGVSRSATICIAEVMRSLNLSFPRAYCFVRARRLNVIIQPHLRFAYELLKWEEKLKMMGRGGGCVMEEGKGSAESGGGRVVKGDGKGGWKRELEWADIAREIAAMNRPYSRQ